MTLADVCVCVSTSTVESLAVVLTLTVLNTNLYTSLLPGGCVSVLLVLLLLFSARLLCDTDLCVMFCCCWLPLDWMWIYSPASKKNCTLGQPESLSAYLRVSF